LARKPAHRHLRVAHEDNVQVRVASAADAEAIARLHADRWRRHYRGAYSDAFLDSGVQANRMALWTERLREPGPPSDMIVADDDERVRVDADNRPGAAPQRRPDNPALLAAVNRDGSRVRQLRDATSRSARSRNSPWLSDKHSGERMKLTVTLD
jgi:hypothetical protein